MRTTAGKTKGETTRRTVFESALRAFRRRGFERTTMREIAEAAGLSLGAAYHYFPSKEALVSAYYEWMQGEHERLAAAAVEPGADLESRLRALFMTKIELLRKDRKLLAASFNYLGDPSHPLSVFGKGTAGLRERSIAQFIEPFDGGAAPAELRELLGKGLWLAHLAVFLFFVHDQSPRQVKTERLVGALCELVAGGVPWLAHPLAAPVRAKLTRLMTELGSSSELST
jgi:AcrR family transcriptional regulator